MLDELAVVFSTRTIASEDVYPSTVEYRLHRIETISQKNEAVSIIYDGKQEVHREHGPTFHKAIERARSWIDEQDELSGAFDLHSA